MHLHGTIAIIEAEKSMVCFFFFFIFFLFGPRPIGAGSADGRVAWRLAAYASQLAERHC